VGFIIFTINSDHFLGKENSLFIDRQSERFEILTAVLMEI
jgi:hypothetical protein